MRAEDIDPVIRAKKSLPDTGVIKVEMTNPEFDVRYTPVASAFKDIKESFKGKTIDLSDLDKLSI